MSRRASCIDDKKTTYELSEAARQKRRPKSRVLSGPITRQDSLGVGAVNGPKFLGGENLRRLESPVSFGGGAIPIVRAVNDLRDRHNLAERAHGHWIGGLCGVVIHLPQLAKQVLAAENVFCGRKILPLGDDTRHNLGGCSTLEEAFDEIRHHSAAMRKNPGNVREAARGAAEKQAGDGSSSVGSKFNHRAFVGNAVLNQIEIRATGRRGGMNEYDRFPAI